MRRRSGVPVLSDEWVMEEPLSATLIVTGRITKRNLSRKDYKRRCREERESMQIGERERGRRRWRGIDKAVRHKAGNVRHPGLQAPVHPAVLPPPIIVDLLYIHPIVGNFV